MIRIEKKNIKNKGFYYLTERLNTGSGFKKIQVYLGKNVPNNLSSFYDELKHREKDFFLKHRKEFVDSHRGVNDALRRVEQYKLDWKYFIAQKNETQKKSLFRDFAIRFIFESNSIEGSRLTEKEVKSIVTKSYIKKSLPRKEVQEALNSIEAIDYIRSGLFRLTQKHIKQLYLIITKDLGYDLGFKKQSNSVNNTNTVAPEDVKAALKNLIAWYHQHKKDGNPFMNAVVFHNKFEHIHPFLDGNGRTGRMILIWMLMQTGYDVLLFKKKNMRRYFSALEEGDQGRYQRIVVYSADAYKKTVMELTR